MSELNMTVTGTDELMAGCPKFDTRKALAAGAAEYKKQWRDHFRALDAKGNRKGFPARGFWIDEGYKKTEIAELTAEQARVTCDSRAVAKRASGGTIRPVSAGALAIPLTAQAYAAGRPSNSGLPLEFVPIKSRKNPAVCGKLVEAAATRISYGKDGSVKKGKGNAATVGKTHYLIVWSVNLKPMGDAVMPERNAAGQAVYAKIGENLRLQAERARDSTPKS